ncbi:MAG: GNAT family N-acetyltransferase [Candidatus Hermodarchaeota archaeon]
MKDQDKIEEKEGIEVPIFIDGDTISLIPHNSKYVNLYIKWFNDPKVRKYAREIIPIRVDDAKKWFEESERGVPDYVGFVIWHKKDKKPIGTIGLGMINWVDGWANLGASIGESAYWNKNLTTEAAKLVIEYAFNELNLNKLQACAAIENIGSWSVAEKLGFEFEGFGKKDMYVDGIYLDEKRYGLLKEDWLKAKKMKKKI